MGDNQDTANNDLNLFSQVQSTHTIVNMASSVPGAAISKRRKFVADGVFFAELNEFFQRELAEEGYSGVEVRVTPTVTDIIIRATHTQEVLGEQGRRIRELTSLIQRSNRLLGWGKFFDMARGNICRP